MGPIEIIGLDKDKFYLVLIDGNRVQEDSIDTLVISLNQAGIEFGIIDAPITDHLRPISLHALSDGQLRELLDAIQERTHKTLQQTPSDDEIGFGFCSGDYGLKKV